MESRTGESTMNGGVHNYIDKIIDVQKHVLFRYAFESNTPYVPPRTSQS